MLPDHLNVIAKAGANVSKGNPPILLVHGAWHGAWCWEGNFLDYFADKGFASFALDLRGHGQSASDKSMRFHRIADYVDDVISVVETLDSPPIVIAHSMGGFVAQHLLHRDVPIAGLGLLATVPHYGASAITSQIATHRPLDFLLLNLKWSLYPLVRTSDRAKRMFLEDDVVSQEANSFWQRLSDESYLGFLDMLFMNLLPKKPENLPPIYIVCGEKDRLFPVNTQLETAQYYGAHYKIVEGAPHDVMLSTGWKKAAEYFHEWIRSL